MKKRIALFLTVLMTLTLMGCGGSQAAQEKAAEKVIEDAVDGDAKVDINGEKYTVDFGDGNKMEVGGSQWPSDAKSNFFPKFTKGGITSSLVAGNMYMISVENVSQADYEEYLQAVKNAGFTLNSFTLSSNETEGYSQYQASDDKGNTMILSYEAGAKALQITAGLGEE